MDNLTFYIIRGLEIALHTVFFMALMGVFYVALNVFAG